MKLAIISHTEHYTAADGTLVGWSPTVNEINHLLEVFDSIVHVAMLHGGPVPKSTMAYVSDRIQFVPLPPLGGPKLVDKLKVLWQAPIVLQTVSKVLHEVDYFQLRTPTGIGVFLIPYLTVFVKTKGWYKYAGNWNQAHPPLGYRWQRWLLKHQSRKVTINGRWPHQPKHCLSFENPCLTEDDIQIGNKLVKHKSLPTKHSICFVGRLEHEKGVGLIFDALKILSPIEKAKIDTIHFVGDGHHISSFKFLSKRLDIQIKFHGVLSRNDVFEIYKICHFLILPSNSEGFPKVVAEAMNFCCVPVVSKVSSIDQYVTDLEDGFLIDPITADTLLKVISSILNLNQDDYLRLIKNQKEVISKFTFSHYNNQLKDKIL